MEKEINTIEVEEQTPVMPVKEEQETAEAPTGEDEETEVEEDEENHTVCKSMGV